MKKIITLFILSNLCFSQIFCQDLEQGLIAHYSFDGNAEDVSGNKNHGKINGVTLSADRSNTPNSCFYFNGRNNYIALPDLHLNKSFSISFWAKFESSNSEHASVFGKWNHYGKRSILIVIKNNNYVTFGISSNSNQTNSSFHSFESKGLNSSEWNYITCTYDHINGVRKIYVNSVFFNEKKTAPCEISDNDATTYIGTMNTADEHFYKGYIDDVRIYNLAISETEVSKLYKYANNASISTSTIGKNSQEGYISDGKNGCKSFTSTTTDRRNSWSGQCLDGFAHDIGKLIVYEKDTVLYTYSGNLISGKFNGQGTMIYADGRKYEGQWKDHNYVGQETITFPDGRKFVSGGIDLKNELNFYDSFYKIDFLTTDQCNSGHILISPDQSQLVVKLSEKNVGVYSLSTGNKVSGFTNPEKEGMLFDKSNYFENFLYVALESGKKFLKIDLASWEIKDVNCHKTYLGCEEDIVKSIVFHSLYEEKTLKIKDYLIQLKDCHIEISRINPEKKAFAEVVSGKTDDCILFLNNYPNSALRDKAEDLMLARSEGTIEGYSKLCTKYPGICEKAELLAYEIANAGNKETKQLFLSKFSMGENKGIIQSQLAVIQAEEKRKADEARRAEEEKQERIKRETEERRIREAEERKIREEQERLEQERIAAVERKKQEERSNAVQINSNSSRWTLGSKVCNELNGGVVVGVINQWNENKSSALIKILSAPTGSKYEGEKLYEEATIWIGTSGKGWHLCLDDEFDVASSQKTDSKVSSAGNSENSGTTGKRGTSATASKYAKLFMKNTYNDCNDDDKSGFSSRILSWETVDFRNQDGYCYAVRIEFGWDCGPTCGRKFEGVLIFEESGCSALFLVEKKTEVMGAIVFSMGLRSLCVPINDGEATEQFNQHFKGDFKWMLAGECIEE